VSYGIVAFALPHFNLATGKNISLLGSQWLLFPSFLLVLLIAFLSAVVPTIQSFGLSLIKKQKGNVANKSVLRTTLMTFQFCVSILLITCTWIVSSQLIFLQSSRVGFDSDAVIVIPLKDRSQNNKHATITSELAKLPGVSEVSFGSSMPAYNNAYTYTYTIQESGIGEQAMAAFLVDDKFFELYNIKLIDGRLPIAESRDTLAEVVLNRAAVEQFHLSQAIGSVVTGRVKGKVVGIVENFNFESLHSPVKPMIMYSDPQNFRFVSIRLSAPLTKERLAEVEKVWEQFYHGFPVEYFYLDDKIEMLYASEFQLRKAYVSFSIMAIVIAAIGLIGLTTYLMSRRLKELSIRKVFGSSTFQLVTWIYSGYFKIVIIATIAAWGVGYYWMHSWLNGFAFKTEIKISHFVLPAASMIVVLLLATILQTFKASRTNPVNHLRDE
jgi:putative ABC transport system permease protein